MSAVNKMNKIVNDAIKKELIPFLSSATIKFLSLDFAEDSETYNKLLEQLSNDYDEKYVNVQKKRSPRKTPKKEEETDVYLTYEEFVKKQEENPDNLYCSWIFTRGEKASKHCGLCIQNKDVWSQKQIDDYEVRCDKCKRNNSEKANATNKSRYLSPDAFHDGSEGRSCFSYSRELLGWTGYWKRHTDQVQEAEIS